MKEKIYTTKQALEITGETRQRVQYWVVSGVLTPADLSAGTGTSRGFSFANLLEIMISRVLSLAGLHVYLIGTALADLREKRPDFFESPGESTNDRTILSVRALSKRSGIVNVHTLSETRENLGLLLADGFMLIQLDIDTLKSKLLAELSVTEWH